MMRRDVSSIFVGDLWKAVRLLEPADDLTLGSIVAMLDLFGALR